MDRFESMSAFAAVVEAGGFSAAARKLGMPLATVSRKVSELEDLLRVSLINRSTRRITLTDSGQSFYESCRRLLEELAEAERAASGEFRAPCGDLTLTAPIVFGRLHIVPIVVEFLKVYPDVNVRLVLVDRIVNLVEEQVDLAVRISELPDSSQIAVRVGEIRSVICASPDYLNQYGVPRHPQELVNHDCITGSTPANQDAWPFRTGKGIKPFPVRARLVVTTAEAAIDAAIAGAGLARALCYQVCDAEKAGVLVRVLRDFEPEPSPLSLIYRNSRKIPAKLRAFIDYAVPRLKQRLQRL